MACMNYRVRILVLYITVFYSFAATRIVSHETIIDVLSANGFQTFAAWCQETYPMLYGGIDNLTVFAFNDTSFTTMPSGDRARLMNMTMEEKRQYVQTYTLRTFIDEFRDSSTRTSINGMHLFINQRRIRLYSTEGNTSTYVNGAMIIGQIPAINGIIHILDRPLGLISTSTVYGWITSPDDPSVQTVIWKNLTAKLYDDFSEAVLPIATIDKVTFFLPSENALRKIPADKIQSLQGQELANYFQMHYIKNHVVYTSYVQNYESYQTAHDGSRVIFMRQADGQVFVKSDGVKAMIERGNITVRNGVIHIIDRMFGFVYNSAREQIAQDAPTFNLLIDQVSPELQALIAQLSGVNMLVPTEDAFNRVKNLRGVNFDTNSSLVDYVVRLCMLKDDIEVSQLYGNYDKRQRRHSRYNDWEIVIYNDKNASWVNSGYVRARIVNMDIKVTNGLLQYIDAVPGVPSYDIPSLIYSDNFLIKTYMDFKTVGLIDYLIDQSFDRSNLPQEHMGASNVGSESNFENTNQNQTTFAEGSSSNSTCGNALKPCQFTVFVPNDTAIYNYNMTSLGNIITRDLPRYRWVLERLIIPDQLIFLEQMAVSSQSLKYRALNGDDVFLRKETENTVRLSWGGLSARVIMSDLGATNGIVHIVDNVLSSSSDTSAGIVSSHASLENIIG